MKTNSPARSPGNYQAPGTSDHFLMITYGNRDARPHHEPHQTDLREGLVLPHCPSVSNFIRNDEPRYPDCILPRMRFNNPYALRQTLSNSKPPLDPVNGDLMQSVSTALQTKHRYPPPEGTDEPRSLPPHGVPPDPSASDCCTS